jgi:hypothetical protein
LDKTKLKEMDSLFVLSLLFRTWLEVTTEKNGFITQRLCRVKSIHETSQTIVVQDEYDTTTTIDLKTITNVIVLDL